MSMWIEDLKSGDIVKAELFTLVNKWWLIPALEYVIVPTRYVYKCITVADIINVLNTQHDESYYERLNYVIEHS